MNRTHPKTALGSEILDFAPNQSGLRRAYSGGVCKPKTAKVQAKSRNCSPKVGFWTSSKPALFFILISLLSGSLRAQTQEEAGSIRLYLQRLGGDYLEVYQKEAQQALSKMGRQALPFLIEALKDPDADKRSRIVEILGNIKDRRAVPYLLHAYEQSDSMLIRSRILEALGKMGDPSVFNFIASKAKNPDLSVRSFAIWALGETRSRKAVPILLEVLKTDKGYPVLTALDALGKCGSPEQAPKLLEFLRYEDVQTRYVAALSLGEIGDEKTVPQLFEAMAKETDIEVQETLAKSLGKIGGPGVILRYLNALKLESNPAAQRLAEMGLQAAGQEAAFPLIDLLKGNDLKLKIASAKILGALKASGAAPHLVKMLQEEDQSAQVVAISALGEVGDDSVVQYLSKAVQSGEPAVRMAAAEAIQKIAGRKEGSDRRPLPGGGR